MANVESGTLSNMENMVRFLGSWSGHVESWTRHNHQQIVVVRYKDLLD